MSFYEPTDRPDTFIATEHTRGPWSSDHQHGGPPSALIARALERATWPIGPVQIARITIELLRPVPIAPLTVTAEVERAGKRTQHLRAMLKAGDQEILRATAISLRTTTLELPPLEPARRGIEDELPENPEKCPPFEFPFFKDKTGYHKSMELRFARGIFGKTPTTVWMRARYPIISGEIPTPLQRVMLCADSGNGVSILLDTRQWTFLNPDLTVHLFRLPEGEWIGLDAITQPAPHGIGLAESRLWDQTKPIGRALQTLLIEKR